MKLTLLFLFLTAVCFSQIKNPDITAKEIYEHIKYLASDELKGRNTGSEEIREAAEYIKKEFESYGLSPAFGNSYFQPFKFNSSVKLESKNELTIYVNGEDMELEAEKDFMPLPFSGSKSLKGDLVFAGFGIQDLKNNYDDYKGIDVKGKVVVIFRLYPDFQNSKSPFAIYKGIRQKAKIAKESGASGLIIVNGYEDIPFAKDDEFIRFAYDRAPLMTDFPVVQIKRKYIEKIFQIKGNSLENLFNMIDVSKEPSPLALDGITVSMSTGVKIEQGECINVGAILEGSDPVLKNEYIVVGAHYDHLGMGGENSLNSEKTPQIHNGADDNASGTTGVLELAEKFAAMRDKVKRSMIFIAFSGEELGLLGSAFFANNSPVTLESIAAMINMDMIGRMDSSKTLIVYGTGTSTKWNELLSKNNPRFTLTMNADGFGGSDHSSFYAKKIPVLFFFTGIHTDYHKPTDDYDKINPDGEKEILEFVYTVINELVVNETKPDYVSVQKKETESTGGWRVYVGTVPDFASQEEGFKISAVNDGSPAAKGGIKPGDLMVKFGSKTISNIYDYVYALQEYKPGDEVEVIVRRENKEVKLQIILGMK